MKKSSLAHAINAAKILLVLGASATMATPARAQKSINRLRARLESTIVTLALTTDKAVEAHMETYIESVYDGLVQELKHVDVAKLISDQRLAFDAPSPRHSKSIRVSARELTNQLDALAKPTPQPATARVSAALEVAGQHPARAMLESDFASLVKNVEWLSVLTALGLQLSEAALVTSLQSKLQTAWGSTHGKAQIPERFARFYAGPNAQPAPDIKTAPGVKATPASPAEPAVMTAADVTIVTVALDSKKLLAHPRVQALNVSHHDVTPHIVDLVGAAALPVELRPGQTIEAVATAKLDTLVAGLVARHAAIAQAKSKAAEDAASAQNQKAIEAVRGLGALAAVLKANPELLKQV